MNTSIISFFKNMSSQNRGGKHVLLHLYAPFALGLISAMLIRHVVMSDAFVNSDYITWIDGTKLEGKRYSSVGAVIKRIFCAVICVALFIGVGANFPVASREYWS
jgi:hypothetical protein